MEQHINILRNKNQTYLLCIYSIYVVTMTATTTQVVILHQAPKVIFSQKQIWILRNPFMSIQSMYSLVTSPWCWSHQPDNPSTLKASQNPRCSGDVVALSDDIPETLPCSILVQTVPGASPIVQMTFISELPQFCQPISIVLINQYMYVIMYVHDVVYLKNVHDVVYLKNVHVPLINYHQPV